MSDATEQELEKLRNELGLWRSLLVWGGDPMVIDAFIKGQQDRIRETQDVEKVRDALFVRLGENDEEIKTLRSEVAALREALGDKGPDKWVLMKRGLYYRPNARGYTDNILEAWVVAEDVADQHTCPHDEPVTKHRYEPPEFARAALSKYAGRQMLVEVFALRAFANAILDESRGDSHCGDVGGDFVQEKAVEFGLLESRRVTAPCGATCVCAEWGEFPTECFFKSAICQ